MKYVMEHEGKSYRRFFEDICAIPHVSFNEKGISDYLVKFAEERGLWYYRDGLWNVIIKKPASPGYEDHAPVMIQAHTDMVGEKTPESDFNFDTDPLQLYVEDGWLKAKDTTLGADCGHGVAYMLAVLDDKTLKHPPVEAYFSVQEEAGIGGPRMLDYTQLSAKRLINTDCMFEGTTYGSTSNVVGGDFKRAVHMVKNERPCFALKVAGLAGGHAAVNIYRDQANAIKISGRILFNILKECCINIVSMEGGTIRNGIAEECVTIFAADGASRERISEIVKKIGEAVKDEYQDTDPGFFVLLSDAVQAEQAVCDEDTEDLIGLLEVLPSGAFMRSLKIENFVKGSRNMGTVQIKEGMFIAGYMFRSAMKTQIADFMDEIFTLAGRFGAVYAEEYRYSGYSTKREDPLNKLYGEVYKEATGKELTMNYNHGGTDAGTIIDNMGGMDAMVIGPDTINIHRPGEALNIASFDRTYGYLKTILERL